MPALAPRLAAVFGTLQTNFPAASDLLCFSGVAPVRKQSGNQEVVHFRYARPIFLHQSLVEFAKCSLGQCAWARLLYEHELNNGKSKWMAIRKLAFKWIRILGAAGPAQTLRQTKYQRTDANGNQRRRHRTNLEPGSCGGLHPHPSAVNPGTGRPPSGLHEDLLSGDRREPG